MAVLTIAPGLPEAIEPSDEPVFNFCGGCRYFEPGSILDSHTCQQGHDPAARAAAMDGAGRCSDRDPFPPGEGPGYDLTM